MLKVSSSFFKNLGIAVAAGAVAPKLLAKDIPLIDEAPKAEIKKSPEKIKEFHDIDIINNNDKVLTEKFFKYLENNKAEFKWKRIYSKTPKLWDWKKSS